MLKDMIEAEDVAANRALMRARGLTAAEAVNDSAGLDARLAKRAAEIEAENNADPAYSLDNGKTWCPRNRGVVETHKVETVNEEMARINAENGGPIKSPAFPTIAEALRRRQRAREHFAVRSMLAAAIVSAAYSLIFGGGFGYVAACFFFAGCLLATYVTSYRS